MECASDFFEIFSFECKLLVCCVRSDKGLGVPISGGGNNIVKGCYYFIIFLINLNSKA